MATFMENIKIIETAVYGKEMRPAIVEALASAKNQIADLLQQSLELERRVDELAEDPGGGGGGSTSAGCVVSGETFVAILASITDDVASGEAIAI